MPIRWRLSLWFFLILSVILVSSSFFLYSLVHHYLTDEVDDSLERRSTQVHDVLVREAEDSDLSDREILESSLPIVDEFSAPGIYIQLVNKDLEVVVKSHNLGEQNLPVQPGPVSASFAGGVDIETISVGEGARLRIMFSPIPLEHETLVVEVGRSLNHVDDTMDTIRLALIATTLTALAIAVLSGFILARRALAPVEDITAIAQHIAESSNMARRVGYKGPKDEIGNLARTFDYMIERLHHVFESQEQFVAAASHDLRSPLAVIRTNLDLLDKDLSEEDRRESIRSMQREVARMTLIMDELLLLAELQSVPLDNISSVSLCDLIDETVDLVRKSAGERELLTNCPQDIVIFGNQPRLRRMLENLVDNAIKYTSDDGIITVSLTVSDDLVEISVADNGIGIDPKHIDYVFERFFRTDRARARDKGSGLGLAIAKAIAEQHGGSISLTSKLGNGSVFTVTLKTR